MYCICTYWLRILVLYRKFGQMKQSRTGRLGGSLAERAWDSGVLEGRPCHHSCKANTWMSIMPTPPTIPQPLNYSPADSTEYYRSSNPSSPPISVVKFSSRLFLVLSPYLSSFISAVPPRDSRLESPEVGHGAMSCHQSLCDRTPCCSMHESTSRC